jgi:dTDP-4-dehydrorhamnose reductase
MQKILILGAKGMLGSELTNLYKQAEQNNKGKYQVRAWDIDEVDVRDLSNLHRKIYDFYPDIVYNAIAYNTVDSCEDDEEEYEKAKFLNIILPKELAKITGDLEATIVHYSSDYVFDGERPIYKTGKRAPHCCGSGCDGCQYLGNKETISYWQYREDDQPRPLNRYGWSKYKGEQAVEKYGKKYYIIRLSKLFGGGGKNALSKKSFFDIMLEKGKMNNEVKVIDDELSKFTYAPDLARESKNIIEENEPKGIYHIVNEGVATWYEGAKTLYKLFKLDTKIIPVKAEEFVRPAQRAKTSILKNSKRKPLRFYEEALKEWIELKFKNSY